MARDDRSGLTSGQYRVLVVGFCVPVALGGFALGIALHAIVSPGMNYFAYAVSLPAIAVVWLVQYRLWRAAGLADAAKRQLVLAQVRRLYAIPVAMVAAGLGLSAALLALGSPAAPPGVPLHALLVAAVVQGAIGALFLPLTMRGRSYLPQA